MDPIIAVIIIVAIAAGIGLGWFLGTRSGAPLRDELATLRDRIGAAEREGATYAERAARAEQLQKLRDAVTGERDEAQRLYAALNAAQGERDKAVQKQVADLKDLEAKLEIKFGALAGQAIEQAHTSFLKRAEEKLGVSGAQNEAKLTELLQPMRLTLQRYEADLRELEKDRKGAYEGLNSQISMMREGQDRVATEALRLRTALRSSSGDVGRWGEDQCRNVLERAGLQEGIDFQEQVSTDKEGDRTKPDFVVNIPGDRTIVIDVKCSLDAFIGATETDEETVREKLLKDHTRAIRTHAQSLMKKSYQDKFRNSATFIVMFVPGENFLHAAIQRDRSLLSDGQKGNIMIVGPSNLLSIILNVAALRDQARLAERAENIGALGRRLYENLSTLGKKAHAMSGAMRSAVKNWNSLVTSLDGHWLSTARKFDELGVGKNSHDVREIDSLELSVSDAQKLGGIGVTVGADVSEIAVRTTHTSPPPSANEDDAAA